jgi:hypothetical protein
MVPLLLDQVRDRFLLRIPMCQGRPKIDSGVQVSSRTVLREIPNVLAIVLIGNPSVRCSLRISAQSSTDNNSLLLSAQLHRKSVEGGQNSGDTGSDTRSP